MSKYGIGTAVKLATGTVGQQKAGQIFNVYYDGDGFADIQYWDALAGHMTFVYKVPFDVPNAGPGPSWQFPEASPC